MEKIYLNRTWEKWHDENRTETIQTIYYFAT